MLLYFMNQVVVTASSLAMWLIIHVTLPLENTMCCNVSELPSFEVQNFFFPSAVFIDIHLKFWISSMSQRL